MSSCAKNPVELVLATTDPSLYNDGSWTWSGVLYWAVECLYNGQSTVSDRVVPSIPRNVYLPITENPTVWNYCKSQKCSRASKMMHVVFTFNPSSDNPMDYLQFVVDTGCSVTYFPRHSITDDSGEVMYIDISEVSKMIKEPYVEVWITKTTVDQKLESTPIDVSSGNIYLPPSPTETGRTWLLWIGAIAVVVLLLIVAGILFPRKEKQIKTIGTSNIY